MAGRVDVPLDGTSVPGYSMYADGAAPDRRAPAAGAFATAGMQHALERSPVADLFFSRANVAALHEGLRYRVYVESGARRLIIGRQSDTELGVIMRAIYLQSARNSPDESTVAQVRELNAAVLAFAVPRVVQEMSTYMQYRQDASSMPVPIPRGEFASSKGTRVVELGDL